MKILVNGNPDIVSVDAGTTLEQLNRELKGFLNRAGLAIIGLKLDGREVTLDDASVWNDNAVDAYSTLEVSAISHEQLCLSTLQELHSHLFKLASQMQQVAVNFQMGRMSEAFVGVRTCVEGWSTVVEGVENIHRLSKIWRGGGEDIYILSLAELKRNLRQVKVALEAGDSVTLGDLWEYEFKPLAEKWQELVKRMAEEIEKKARGPQN